jgi:hypothetical protein
MLRRQLIPFLVTLLAAYFSGGSASRLHLVAILFAKPILTIASAALLLFVIQRSPDICRLVLGSSSWRTGDFDCALVLHPQSRRVLRRIALELETPDSPCLQPRFQRPPPNFAR